MGLDVTRGPLSNGAFELHPNPSRPAHCRSARMDLADETRAIVPPRRREPSIVSSCGAQVKRRGRDAADAPGTPKAALAQGAADPKKAASPNVNTPPSPPSSQ